MTGKDYLDQVFTGVNSLLDRLMEQIFGARAGATVISNLTWADLGATLCLALFFLVLHGLAAAFLRHKAAQAPVNPEHKQLRRHVFGALGKPVYLLIWIYGVYIVATPLLLKLPPGSSLKFIQDLFNKLFDLGVFGVVFWLFFRFTHVAEAWLTNLTGKTGSKLDDIMVPLAGKAMRVILPVVGLIFALPLLGLPVEYDGIISKGTSILLIVAVTVILFQAVAVGEQAVLTEYDITAADNLEARKIYTQVHVISKTLYVIIGLFSVASILMLFEEVRRFGTSLLASAGVVGIIIGFAAQKTISNLFAGFQLAMTQPIRLDDVVIVEGEWGRIEEITLTYVVLHIWDSRRLVIPLSYFIEKPFQNWTRTSADLMGTISLWTDYTLPLEDVRKFLKELIESNPLWDKRFWNLQVVEATERTMQIRVLVTTADSGKGWDLRCLVREKLIEYIQKNHPQCLPRTRAEIDGGKEKSLLK
jgi:small-conductance mechanosensitive channel